MQVEDVKKVLIIGAGTMGQQIGFLCALNGFDTTIYDLSREILDRSRTRLNRLAEKFTARRRVGGSAARTALDRISMNSDPEAAADGVDFVSESVYEDVELKCRVFETFHRLCPPAAVFTTNSSSLIPSMMADATGRPDKFAAFHFHNTLTSVVVDIMPHPGTAPETITLIEGLARRLGQAPILIKRENHGYVFNAMLMNLCDTALYLAAGGIATIEDIDRSWMGVMNSAIGPFGIMDSIGLDTTLRVNEIWASQLNDPRALSNVAFLEQYVDRGKLGTKSGEGFYTYPGPAFQRPDFLFTR
jgi:3-hydroxybutyryl-CoA dehydrogenase